MRARCGFKSGALPILLVLSLLFSGCGIATSYRPADKKTIRDFDASGAYRKRIGVLALVNTTVFTSDQLTAPFLDAFLSGLKSTVPDAQVLLPGTAKNAHFLYDPPLIDNGDIDVFALAAQSRQTGMNAVVSPMIMDIRTSKYDSGFWFFREVSYLLQIQTAATVYDTITGSRLSLGILTETIDISEAQANAVESGRETTIEALVEIARDMGEQLGEQMGKAVEESRWTASVVSVEDGNCVIPAGSEVGIQPGDRFSVLDVSDVLTGLNGQRFLVPGLKIGEITVSRADSQQAFGTPQGGNPPPVGSIVVPDKN